jgi:hypothetical protein
MRNENDNDNAKGMQISDGMGMGMGLIRQTSECAYHSRIDKYSGRRRSGYLVPSSF